jgi:hypothetical protein
MLNADDLEMDPIAWQMSFGAVIIFTFMKDAQMLLKTVAWLQVWLLFVVPLTLGHLYGASRYFFWILQVNSRDLGVNSQDLGVSSRDLGVHSQDLGVNSQDLGVNSQDLGVNSRDLGVHSQDLGVNTRDLGIKSRDLGVNFFWILQDDWPCFTGQGNYSSGGSRDETEFGMCYKGRLLVSFTSGVLFLTTSSFILWRNNVFYCGLLKERGELEDDVDIDELLRVSNLRVTQVVVM